MAVATEAERSAELVRALPKCSSVEEVNFKLAILPPQPKACFPLSGRLQQRLHLLYLVAVFRCCHEVELFGGGLHFALRGADLFP